MPKLFDVSAVACWITCSPEEEVNPYAYKRPVKQVFSDGSSIEYPSANAAWLKTGRRIEHLINKDKVVNGCRWVAA